MKVTPRKQTKTNLHTVKVKPEVAAHKRLTIGFNSEKSGESLVTDFIPFSTCILNVHAILYKVLKCSNNMSQSMRSNTSGHYFISPRREKTRPQGYQTFMLNSAEHEIYLAHKC